jgi:hypothetical protein
MPDISMCANKNCPSRKTCYRYLAKPNEQRQSYAIFKQDKDIACEYYTSKDGYGRVRELPEADAYNKEVFDVF